MKIFILLATLVLILGRATCIQAQERDAQADQTTDAAMRSQVVEAVVKNMRDYYVFPEVGQAVERTIREHQKSGDYERIKGAAELAKTLTEQLREITKDKHVSVNYSAKP